MKTPALNAALLAALLFNFGCTSKPDSTATADKANDQKIEKTDSAGAKSPTTAATPGDAKDVASYMVGLANTGRTEYELSKLAATRATSPAVKTYAAKTVAQHAKDEAELKVEAAKYSVTLPTALNNDSQDLLTNLGKEKAGNDFDRKYLSDMTDVNDKAIGKAKDAVGNTNKPELKQFVDKIMADDQQHLAEAKRLHDAIK